MRDINCEICLDLIPLVRDGVAAEESKRAVHAHIQTCESCRRVWQGGEVPAPAEDAALQKTSRRLRMVWGFLLMLCTLAGLELTNGSGVFYNTLVMPLVGILAYLFFGRSAAVNVPALLLVTHAVTTLFHAVRGEEHLGVFDMVFYTIIYALFALLGVGLAALVHTVLRRTEPARRRIGAGAGALCILAFFGVFASSLVGNPVSRMLAEHSAEEYVQAHHPDCAVDDVSYSFKTGGYDARVSKPGSVDHTFTVSFDAFGRFVYSAYESEVAEHFSTWRRLDDAYRSFAKPILQSPLMPFAADSAGCSLRMASYEENGALSPDSDGLDYRGALETDGVYNVLELAAQYGEISLFVDDPDVSVENAADILLTLRRTCDEAGIPAAYFTLSLHAPRGEDGNRVSSDFVFVDSFPYAQVYEQELAPRLAAFIDQSLENAEAK